MNPEPKQSMIDAEAPWMQITTMAPGHETSYHDPCCCPIMPWVSPPITPGDASETR